MEIMELFKIPEQKHTKNGFTCRSCRNAEPWQCGSRVIYYCMVLKSNRTINGLKKIKLKYEACLSFSEK